MLISKPPRHLFIRDLTSDQIAKLERRMRPFKYNKEEPFQTQYARAKELAAGWGDFSQVGFLGPDERLVEVIEADRATLQRHGITHKQVADRLKSLMHRTYFDRLQRHIPEGVEIPDPLTDFYEPEKRGITVVDDNVLIDGKFRVAYHISTNGVQTCPFFIGEFKSYRCCGESAGSSDNFAIANAASGEQISFSQLHPHLIATHEFFEGRDTSYRLDPETAVRVLELAAGVDYSPKIISDFIWSWISTPSARAFTKDEIDKNKSYGGRSIESIQRELQETLSVISSTISSPERTIQIIPGVVLHLQEDLGVIVSDKDIRLEKGAVIDGKEWISVHEVQKGETLIRREEREYVVG